MSKPSHWMNEEGRQAILAAGRVVMERNALLRAQRKFRAQPKVVQIADYKRKANPLMQVGA